MTSDTHTPRIAVIPYWGTTSALRRRVHSPFFIWLYPLEAICLNWLSTFVDMLSIWYNFVEWYAQAFGYAWVWGYDTDENEWFDLSLSSCFTECSDLNQFWNLKHKMLLIAKPKELDLCFELMLVYVNWQFDFKVWRKWLQSSFCQKGIHSPEYSQK